jgi:hypothetical protein|tara:strand:- start:124 stop:246 length:123 start_codon:yes stop_codon:yes gene_type:complete
MVRERVPGTHYIPSNFMMWDIMQACMKVLKVEDLWFNKKK